MPRKTLILLILLVVVPLLAFAWLGWRAAKGEEARLQQGYQRLFETRLAQENDKLSNYFDVQRRELARLTRQCRDQPERLRELVRTSPLIRQAFVLDRNGDLVHPSPAGPVGHSEREFLTEVQQLIEDKDLIRAAFGTDGRQSVATGGNTSISTEAASNQTAGPDHAAKSDTRPTKSKLTNEGQPSPADPRPSDGWYVWYFGRGGHLLYWHRWSDQRVTILALSRARWMSDLLTILPDSRPTKQRQPLSNDSADWQIRLVDSADQLVYQWGQPIAGRSEPPRAQLSVAAPLSAWRLKYYCPAAVTRYSRLPVLAGMCSLAIGLLGMAFVLYRDYSRDIREARQRVNFVNQVSHELKTPLTNIRMYADLLEMDLDALPADTTAKPRSHLHVIISESQRLTRLIANVLSFARSERDQLQIHRRRTELDRLIKELLDRFGPSLESAGIHVEASLNLPDPVQVDPDVVQQIVGNLISNALNYAADGGYLGVRIQRHGEWIEILVSDRGPGISSALERRLFEPFVRGSDRLSDASGTGIGLSIARRLARAHGGDVTLAPSTTGATFRVTILESP